jgi:hypothetical protein
LLGQGQAGCIRAVDVGPNAPFQRFQVPADPVAKLPPVANLISLADDDTGELVAQGDGPPMLLLIPPDMQVTPADADGTDLHQEVVRPHLRFGHIPHAHTLFSIPPLL